MAAMPDLKIKGRLVFRPETGDTEHDLGEVEFTLTPQPAAPVKRGRFASGGVVLPTGPTPGSGISRAPIDARLRDNETVVPRAVVREMVGDLGYASRGFTVDMYNGRA